MEIRKVKIKDLNPATYNPRNITDESLKGLEASLSRFGYVEPICWNEKTGNVVGGHQRLKVLQKKGEKEVDVVVVSLNDIDEKALNVALNNKHIQGDWDYGKLDILLSELKIEFDGYDEIKLDALEIEMDDNIEQEEKEIVEDEAPEVQEKTICKSGDLWTLGKHRLLCGDSTKKEDVEKLMDGKKADMVHADPPYGMGKENAGIANDNLYAEKLDAFLMLWWLAFRPSVKDNGSAYIWGNAEDLWRLWYVGGLKNSERLTLRNEIVWNKKHGQGMDSEQHRMFPTASERCLFFMLGEQGFNNNAENYWDGWDSILNYLQSEKKKSGLTIKDFKKIAGKSENSGCHWFDKSEWYAPTKEIYLSWQNYCKENNIDAFKREHDELKREFYKTRAYFDNTHENMTDVWDFPRVTGDERHGHATPKPVALVARAIKSSAQINETVIDPFLGSGTTLIACEQLDRICYGMEISEKYCDVIIRRFQNISGKDATRQDGKKFNELETKGE